MHELAVAGLARVVVAVAVAAAMFDDAGDIAVAARWLAFGVVGVVVVVAGDLHLRLRYRVGTAIAYAWDVCFFLCSAAIHLGFGVFR